MDRVERVGVCLAAGAFAGYLIWLRDPTANPYRPELRLGISVAVVYVPACIAFAFRKHQWAVTIAIAGTVGVFAPIVIALFLLFAGGTRLS